MLLDLPFLKRLSLVQVFGGALLLGAVAAMFYYAMEYGLPRGSLVVLVTRVFSSAEGILVFLVAVIYALLHLYKISAEGREIRQAMSQRELDEG